MRRRLQANITRRDLQMLLVSDHCSRSFRWKVETRHHAVGPLPSRRRRGGGIQRRPLLQVLHLLGGLKLLCRREQQQAAATAAAAVGGQEEVASAPVQPEVTRPGRLAVLTAKWRRQERRYEQVKLDVWHKRGCIFSLNTRFSTPSTWLLTFSCYIRSLSVR